jgi:hypothetical protein
MKIVLLEDEMMRYVGEYGRDRIQLHCDTPLRVLGLQLKENCDQPLIPITAVKAPGS